MFRADVAGCFDCFAVHRVAGRASETTETIAPLRDIALKHRLPRSAPESNAGEDDVYFRAQRREDCTGIHPATEIGRFLFKPGRHRHAIHCGAHAKPVPRQVLRDRLA